MSAGGKHSKQAETPTSWKQRTGNVTRGETKQQSRGTYQLESREQAMSAGKSIAMKQRCSQSGKQRTSNVS